MPVDHSMES